MQSKTILYLFKYTTEGLYLTSLYTWPGLFKRWI